ncbi:unnamed protein product [Orchesella dallaii]|uniref:TIR domain-containing protein n=1 Tax=Orchesella dallaii TaxID=48710 RepID=A0ABP1QN05_9HEXA
MYRNWLKEMDQLGCRNEYETSTMITTKRIRRGSWRSWSSRAAYSIVFCLILSVGSSMAVMAYRNDLSAISNRHGCVWSRTDSSNGGAGVGSGSSGNSNSSSSNSNNNSFMNNGQQTSQVMYAPGNNPFQPQHNLRTFPALSSSSSVSPYYPSSSLPSSPSSGGAGVLNCNVRTLNADLWNYTSLSREQVEQTRVARVKCSDMLFFESKLLPNQTMFQLRNLQEISLHSCKIRKIPSRIWASLGLLKSLTISSLNAEWSSSVGLEIESGGFEGLSRLESLDLSLNNIYMLEDNVFLDLQLRLLNISSNSISALSSKVFSGLSSLLSLDLSRNSLSSQRITGDAFESLVRLVILNLSHNQLTTLSPATFRHLNSLQVLHLGNNGISSIAEGAFETLINLHNLDLSNNRISSLDGKVFSNLFVLRQLYLDHNQLRSDQMHPESMRNLTSLEDLGLVGNDLESVPQAIKGLNLKTLDLGENTISIVDSLLNMGQLIGLRLVDNKLTELPPNFCKSLKNLRVLNVAQNRISKISPGAFSACPDLRALRLDANLLQQLPPILAPQLPSLLWLNVSENRLQFADYRRLPSTLEWLDVSHNELVSLGGLMSDGGNTTIPLSLRVIDASYNKLKSLDNIPPTLETLRLNHNELTNVAPDTFIRSSRLRRVELIGNKLENLPLSALRFPPVPNGKPLPEFFLGKNPFLCNCEMEWLTRINEISVLRQYPKITDFDTISCQATYPRKQVIPLTEATSKDFLCKYNYHCFALCACCNFDYCDCASSCPDNCTCVHDKARFSVNIVTCSNSGHTEIPSRLPMDATEIFLDGNQLPAQLPSHIFIGKIKLLSLYLNNSKIETIANKSFNGLKALENLHLESNLLRELQGFEFSNLVTLRELYLQNNKISYINENTFIGLKFLQVLRLDGNLLVDFNVLELTTTNGYLNSVMLSNNTWTNCDCKLWTSTAKKIVVDFAHIKCNSHNSSAIMGGSTTSTTTVSTITTTNPTISSLCDNPGLLPSAASAGNHAVMNNHISSMGGPSLSSPYHHSHLDSSKGNFPQNENIIATSTAGVGRGTGSKVNEEDGDGSGNSTFLTCLLTFIAIILLASIAFLVGLVLFRRGRFSKCGINGSTSAMPKCLSAPNSGNDGDGVGGSTGGDMDYYYYSDQEKLFDAYFIYSKKDEEFLSEKLTSELERGTMVSPVVIQQQQQQYYPVQTNGKKLRLCLHYRDLCLPDNPWSSEMVHSAADASKRIVLLISNNFLNCEWTNNHFRTSVFSAIQGKRCIIIKLPPVSDQSISTICSTISAAADLQYQQRQRATSGNNKQSCRPPSATILEWGDKNFWPKFRILLPTPQISTTGNNNRTDIASDFNTISSHATSQLPYTTNLNPNGMNFISANNATMLPYHIPMIAGHHHQQYQQASAEPFITLMNWTGQQHSIPSLPLGHSSSVYPAPSQLTPQQFGYSNVDAFHNNMNDQQAILFHQQQQQQQPHLHHHHHQHPGQHIHSLSQLSTISKSPVEANYSSSAVSSGNEDHVYSELESPCSDLGPGHLQFEGATINGAQVNRHQIQHSTSSGISSASGSDATSGINGNGGMGGTPMYFV